MKTFSKFHKFWPILILATTAFAQIDLQIEELPKEQPEENKTESFIDRANFGIKLGLNFPSMSYSNDALDGYSSDIYLQGVFELFLEYAIIPSLSVRPGLKFITRGQNIYASGFDYEFRTKYTEITVPVVYAFQPIINIHPYVLGGPVLGFAHGGRISITNGRYYDTDINDGNLSSYAFGLYFGAGAKCPLLIKEFNIIPGFEIGYHLGLTDTYSDKEHSGTSNALNAPYYNINGTRKHRGLEIGITLSVPLANFKKTKVPEPEKEPEPEKLCYTIDEMKELIRTKQNTCGKKICAVRQVSFQSGKSELTAEDKVYLDEMVVLMQTNELISIRVNGHTDNIGGEEFNINLSRDRAKSVHDYLKSRGIDASRLSFAFFGQRRPISDNDTEDGRTINRRVEFEILTDKKGGCI
ncbi:MAG: OmpA family protein [Fibromonadaceae bacterium]|jgi:OOP family OmpA-OmpF porin|nr:OmpA family protein [Fibromonadaceae bacterium]